jgi:sulfite exporter TauE/SafE/copper chaperone CopZ
MKKIFEIEGMNCNSCAHLIENELKDSVEKISMSYADEKAEIEFDESKITENQIIESIQKLGYRVMNTETEGEAKEVVNTEAIKSEEPSIAKPEETGDELIILKAADKSIQSPKEKAKPRAVRSSKKKKQHEKNANLANNRWIPITISIILALFVLYHFSGFNLNLNVSGIRIPSFGEKTSLILLFLAGMLAGFHCVGMCGGFVVSYTTKNALKGHRSFKQHLVYGGSKVLSYAIIGGLFGAIGGIIAFSIGLRSIVSILAGIFMIFYALSMLGIKFFRRFQFNPTFLTKVASEASNSAKGPYRAPFITGLLNGLFIACGPLQAMYLYATGTGSFIAGAASLAAFGLGTLPVMLGFGSLATVISHRTTKRILKISAIIVIILGLLMINRGLTLGGSSYNYDSIKSKIIGANAVTGQNSQIVGGVQEINMDVDASGYKPNSFVLKRGVPVKWNINVKQLTGCNSELVANEYGININLKAGKNLAEFTPNKIGTFTFSCGMGMIRGSFIVTETGQATQQEIKSATPKSAGGCGCGGG